MASLDGVWPIKGPLVLKSYNPKNKRGCLVLCKPATSNEDDLEDSDDIEEEVFEALFKHIGEFSQPQIALTGTS